MVDSKIKKPNINKKKLNSIKFKQNQSPIEIYEIIRGYYAFFQLSEWRQNNLIDEVLKRFENQPRNVKALIKQQGIYSRLIECQQKKNGSKQVTQPTT
jgi:hypothetical protein